MRVRQYTEFARYCRCLTYRIGVDILVLSYEERGLDGIKMCVVVAFTGRQFNNWQT
jgi:hypothetical protein